ncbi:MAG: HPr family phosphocarrier protein [Candidatus Limnocylindria bacterium]
MSSATERRRLSTAPGAQIPYATADVRLAEPLHARAAAAVVELTSSLAARITVSRGWEPGQPADARSVLALLALRLGEGEMARIEAYGDDAERAVASVAAMLARGGTIAAHE